MSAIRMLFILVMFSGLLIQNYSLLLWGEKKKVRNRKFENLPRKIQLLDFVNASYAKFKQPSLLLKILQNKIQTIGSQGHLVPF